jgi:glycosyltransferase involved in cell wall biosynthesis
LLAYNILGDIKIRSFYSERGMDVLYGTNLFLKLIYLIFFIIRRKLHVIEALFHENIFIHRELMPLGPPINEWFLNLMGKRIIYDFDDAIWMSNVSDVNRIFDFVKSYYKVKYIIRWADLVTVGNSYLGSYAKQFNNNVKLLPSTVDMVNIHNQTHEFKASDKLIIGWTGSHTTASKYLPFMENVLKELMLKFPLRFIVISNQKPNVDIPNLEYTKWNGRTEIHDLIQFDIGIMPLGDEEWEKGKCSFKAIQYMALGIPTVLSPKGNNIELVTDSKDGLFACSEEEWKLKLTQLIENAELRRQIGRSGQKTIKEKYSLESKAMLYRQIFS